MKDYTEYSVHDIIDYGITPFLAMSILYFEILSQEIEYIHEVRISDELQSKVQQYCEIALNSIGQSTPDHKVPSKHYDPDALLKAWKNLFLALDEAGYKDTIQNWLDHLMQIDTQFSPIFNKSQWEGWFLGKERVQFIKKGPDLPLIPTLQLTVIFQHEQLQFFMWCCKMEHWGKGTKNAWLKYVLEEQLIASWIRRTLSAYDQLKMWEAFFECLNEEELNIFEEWGRTILEKLDPDCYFNLPEFAITLKAHRYLLHPEYS